MYFFYKRIILTPDYSYNFHKHVYEPKRFDSFFIPLSQVSRILSPNKLPP